MSEETWGLVVKLLGISYVLFERWLGRTKLVKANSTLDLINDVGVYMIRAIKARNAKQIEQEGGSESCNSKKLKN